MAFSQGDLPDERLCAIAEHLEICSPCSGELERLPFQIPRFAGDWVTFRFQGEPECERMVDAAKVFSSEAPVRVVLEDDKSNLTERDTEAAEMSGSTSHGRTVIRPPPPPELDFPRRYELRRFLGRGGFGEVFAAFDRELEREVALKLMREDRLNDQHVAQFREEARKLAQVRHRAVLEVHDVGRVGHRWYIVTQLVSGGTLLDRIRKGPLPVSDAVQIVAEIAEGLHAAHRLGIIHRDIKPANILMEAGGQPRLTDFGLAVTEEEQLNEAGGPLGTVAYMAPEQIRGDSHFMDARSDVYALGNVLYQALTGRLPFLGQTRSDYRDQICNRLPRPLSTLRDDVPPDLERICLKCLAKDPAERFSTAAELARELRRIPGPVSSPRRRFLVASGIATGTAVLGYLGWLASTSSRNPKSKTEVLVWQDALEQNTLVVTGQSSLVINTQGIAVLGLGTEGEQATRLSMRVRHSPAKVRWGVFHDYGIRRTADERTIQYQTVEPYTDLKGPKVQLGFRGFSPDFTQNPGASERRDEQVPALGTDTHIDVQFFNGTLLSVHVNKRPLSSLAGVSRPVSLPPPEERPRFGVFIVRGAMSVSEIQLNGRPLVLDNVRRP